MNVQITAIEDENVLYTLLQLCNCLFVEFFSSCNRLKLLHWRSQNWSWSSNPVPLGASSRLSRDSWLISRSNSPVLMYSVLETVPRKMTKWHFSWRSCRRWFCSLWMSEICTFLLCMQDWVFQEFVNVYMYFYCRLLMVSTWEFILYWMIQLVIAIYRWEIVLAHVHVSHIILYALFMHWCLKKDFSLESLGFESLLNTLYSCPVMLRLLINPSA